MKTHFPRNVSAAVAAVAVFLATTSFADDTVTTVDVATNELSEAIADAKYDGTDPVVFKLTVGQEISGVLDLDGLAEVTIASGTPSSTRQIVPAEDVKTQLLRQTTENAKLTLTDLTFTAGKLNASSALSSGGAIFVANAELLKATRLVLTKNSVVYSGSENNVTVSGGALALENVKNADLTGTVFGRKYVSENDTGAEFRNVAQNDGTGGAAGGAAWVKSSGGANFTSSEFYYNEAKSKSGTAIGGALALDSSDSAVFTSATFAVNAARSTTGDAMGGGVYVTGSHGTPAVPAVGDAAEIAAKLLNFSSAKFYENTAATQGGTARGGGVFLENSSHITFDSSVVSGNIASVAARTYEAGEEQPETIPSGTHAYGGGLYVNKVSNLSVAKAYIYYNTATATGTSALEASGGGVYLDNTDSALSNNIVFTETEFYGNKVVSDKKAGGGAMAILGRSDSILSLTKNLFSSNTVESKGTTPNTSYARGGAVSILGGGADFTGSTFVKNTVESASDSAASGGGAIYAQNVTDAAINLNLTDVSFGYNEVKTTAANTTSGGGALRLNANNISGMKLTLGATAKNWSGWLDNAIIAGTGTDAKKTGNSIDFQNVVESGSATEQTIDVAVNIGAEGMLDIRDGMTGDANSKVVFNINATLTDTGEWWLGGKSVFKNADTSFTVNRGTFGVYDKSSITFDAATQGTISIKDGATLALFTFTKQEDAALRNAKIVFDAKTESTSGGLLKFVMRDADYAAMGVGQVQQRYFADDASIIVNLTEKQMQATATNYSVNPLFSIKYDPGNAASDCNNFVTMTRISAASQFQNLSPEMATFLDNYRGGSALITYVLNGSNPSVSPDIEIVSALNPGGTVSVTQQTFGSVQASAGASRVAPRVDSGAASPFSSPSRSLSASRDKLLGQLRKKTKSQGFWVMPLYSHDRANNLKAGEHRFGYTSNQFGAAFGLDRAFGAYRFGFAGSAGGGSSKSNGDLVPTSGSTGFGSIYVYGDVSLPANIELWGALGWLGSSTKTEQIISGYPTEATIPGGAFFISLSAERPFRVGHFLVTPSVGLNYNLVYQQEFTTNWATVTLVSTTESATGHTVTLPLGVRVSCDLGLLDGIWTPSLSTHIIPNIGARELEYNVNTSGSIIPAPLRSVIVDPIGGDFGIGSHWRRRNFEGGLDYTFLFSEHFQTHQIAALLSWKF